jgi:hypothetical protein
MSSVHTGPECYFPSKRDWWLVLLIWVAVVVGLVGGLAPVFFEEGPLGPKLFIVGACLGMDGLMLWVLYGTGYTLTQEQLLVRSGPFVFRVSLEEINSITPTRSLLSSPACSLDRLKIIYRHSWRTLMISPDDKRGFLSAIAQRCPTLMLLNDRIMKKKEAESPVPSQEFHPQSVS